MKYLTVFTGGNHYQNRLCLNINKTRSQMD